MKTSFVASSVFLFLMAKAAFSAEVDTTKVGELFGLAELCPHLPNALGFRQTAPIP